MRNHHEIDRVGIVELVGVADDLLELLGEPTEFDVLEGGGERHQVVAEACHRIDGELRSLECLLGSL